MEQIYYFSHVKSNTEYVIKIEKIIDNRTAKLLIFKGKRPFGGYALAEVNEKATFDFDFFKSSAKEIPQDRESLRLAFEFIFGENHV